MPTYSHVGDDVDGAGDVDVVAGGRTRSPDRIRDVGTTPAPSRGRTQDYDKDTSRDRTRSRDRGRDRRWDWDRDPARETA